VCAVLLEPARCGVSFGRPVKLLNRYQRGDRIGPTSAFAIAVVVSAAVAVPVVVVLLFRRRHAGRGVAAALLGAVVAAQLAAVAAVFGVVNSQYGFYPTWGSLLGQAGSAAPISATTLGIHPTQLRLDHRVARGLVEPPSNFGRYVLSTIAGGISHFRQRVNVWLPPQYGDPRYRAVRFPVVMVLGGAYSGDTSVYNRLNFARLATSAIQTRRVAPFIAIYPRLNHSVQVDTECVDFPGGGPQSYSWLARDVPTWAKTHLRVSVDPRRWSVMGWSTGGYCAAKLHLLSPGQFAAAAAVEGYFAAEPDATTGNLAQVLRANPRLTQQNNLGWVITHHPPRHTHLLVATSLADPQSKSSSLTFLHAAKSEPGVQSYIVASLGHSMPAFKDMTPNVLTWLAGVAGA